jgi:hypothetical protein
LPVLGDIVSFTITRHHIIELGYELLSFAQTLFLLVSWIAKAVDMQLESLPLG